MQPGVRALNDLAGYAQTDAVRLASLRDHGSVSALPEESAVLVVVVAAVGAEGIRPTAWSSDAARDDRDLVQEWQKLRDVVAVSAGQRHRERDDLAVGDDVGLTARPCAVDRAGAALGPRRAARTWEESIAARDQSSWFFDRTSFSSMTCSRSQTPASFQAASRRRQTVPEPNPNLWGRYSHWMPVCRHGPSSAASSRACSRSAPKAQRQTSDWRRGRDGCRHHEWRRP